MSPLVYLVIDLRRLTSLRTLGDSVRRTARVHLCDDPIAVENLVSRESTKRGALDQRSHAKGVLSINGHEHEPHEVTERFYQSKSLDHPPSLRLTYRLTTSPPFAPCPRRWTISSSSHDRTQQWVFSMLP